MQSQAVKQLQATRATGEPKACPGRGRGKGRGRGRKPADPKTEDIQEDVDQIYEELGDDEDILDSEEALSENSLEAPTLARGQSPQKRARRNAPKAKAKAKSSKQDETEPKKKDEGSGSQRGPKRKLSATKESKSTQGQTAKGKKNAKGKPGKRAPTSKGSNGNDPKNGPEINEKARIC